MRCGLALLISLLLTPALAAGNEALQAIDAMAALHERARAAQQEIDEIHARTERAREQARLIEHEGTIDALEIADLEQQIAVLENVNAELAQDIRATGEAQSGIVALLAAMIDALEAFVALDLPFRPADRAATIADLRRLLTDSSVSVAAKYQAVAAAYLREIDFGNAAIFERVQIATPEGERVVDLLRIGRAGLWYVTPDGTQAGRYDRDSGSWIAHDVEPAAVLRAGAIVAGRAAPLAVYLPLETSP